MSQGFSRRSLLGAVIAAFLGFFSGKRASAIPQPTPCPAPPPIFPGNLVPLPPPSNCTTYTYTYDAQDNLTFIAYPGGSITTHVYDAQGNSVS